MFDVATCFLTQDSIESIEENKEKILYFDQSIAKKHFAAGTTMTGFGFVTLLYV